MIEKGNAHKVFSWGNCKETACGRPRRGQGDNIKMDVKNIGWKGVD
jgi:hypothetical protein